jgi:hypothetical protein
MAHREGAGWEIFPHAVFYNSGLAVDDLERLRLHETVSRIGALESELPNGVPTEGEQGGPADSIAALFNSEFADSRRALREIVSRESFQEALFTTNANLGPDMIERYLKRGDSQKRRSKERRFELSMMRYIQRAAMKTHVASRFGLVNFARFDRSSRDWLQIRQVSSDVRAEREVFFGMWMVEAIADALSRDPDVQPYLVPRLNAVCEVDGMRAIAQILNQERALTGLQSDLLPRLGQSTIRELASALNEDLDHVIASLLPLVPNFVSIRPVVPSTIFHPFAALLDFVEQLPCCCVARDRYLESLRHLDALRVQYRDSSLADRVECLQQLEQKFAVITGQSPRRAPGCVYADRLLVYEEIRGDVKDCVFGRPFVADLVLKLNPILDLCSLAGELYLRHIQEICRRVLSGIQASAEEVPFLDFVERLQEMGRSGAFAEASADMLRFEEDWTNLVRGRCDGGIASLCADDVYGLLSRYGGARPSAHAAVDLMIAASSQANLENGDHQIVVGEVGENVMIWGSQFYFYNQRRCAEEQARNVFANMPGYDRLAIILPHRTHKGFLNESFAGTFVQAFAESQRTDVLKPSDLRVVEENGRVRLKSRKGDCLQFFHHHDDLVHLWAFAAPRVFIPPVGGGSHIPRIEIQGVVLQREQWIVPASQFAIRGAAPFDLYRRIWAAKQSYSLPDRVFVHFPDEVKPIFIDFHSGLSAEVLAQMSPLEGELRIVETVPDVDQCWLCGSSGRYATELRILAYRRGIEGLKS